jgi:hypothetical protein
MNRNDAHPFLICRAEDFPELRRRAEQEPWRTMRAGALRIAAAGVDTTNFRSGVHRSLGARALAYILEPERAEAHAVGVREVISNELAAMPCGYHDPAAGNPWKGTVPPLGAVFVALIALDIVQPSLSAADIEACEEVIAERLGRVERTGPWPLGRLGAFGTWDIYRGARTEPDDAYYETYLRQITEDGVTRVATNYAFARLGSGDDRPQKTGYADVLEFTGIDRRYYNEPRLAQFYRWLCGSSLSPARKLHPFGDVILRRPPPPGMGLYRIGRFDRQAAAYAAWLLDGAPPPGHVLPYVLMREPLPEPEVPMSRLYDLGGAFLREPEDDPLGLGCALYNMTGDPDWHAHEEVNAVSLAASGTRLLVNGGWLGETTRPAALNNTLSFAGEDHVSRAGGGLAEGFVADGFDYAAGDAGAAIRDARYTRSIALIHSGNNRDGFFAIADEIETDREDTLGVCWQLASETPARELEDRRVFEAMVDHPGPGGGAGFRLALAPAPQEAEQEPVPSGDLERDPEAGRHVRLTARYAAAGDRAAVRRLLTVVVPFDRARPPADIVDVGAERAASGLAALRIMHPSGGGDLVALASPELDTEVNGLRFRGAFFVRRFVEGGGFRFLRLGTRVEDGGVGFTADAPVSVYLSDTGVGGLTAESDTRVSFRFPGLTGLELNGRPLGVIGRGGGDELSFEIPAGRHRFACSRDRRP